MANLKNIEFDGVEANDYPDFSNAHIIYAENEDGTELTEEELEKVEAGDYWDEMYQTLID